MQVVVREFGTTRFVPMWRTMQQFTRQRTDSTADEIWITQHEPVFTLGLAGRREHVLQPGTIDVVETDRGGQVTYHGPGQLVVYLLFNLKRLRCTVHDMVRHIEQAMLKCLGDLGINGRLRDGAPGVYVGEAKIGALGLRVSRGCSYHGMSMNVKMDLRPFRQINPCGMAGLAVTQVCDEVEDTDEDAVQPLMIDALVAEWGFAETVTLKKPWVVAGETVSDSSCRIGTPGHEAV